MLRDEFFSKIKNVWADTRGWEEIFQLMLTISEIFDKVVLLKDF